MIEAMLSHPHRQGPYSSTIHYHHHHLTTDQSDEYVSNDTILARGADSDSLGGDGGLEDRTGGDARTGHEREGEKERVGQPLAPHLTTARSAPNLLLITGPNGSGKSTYLKQVGPLTLDP